MAAGLALAAASIVVSALAPPIVHAPTVHAPTVLAPRARAERIAFAVAPGTSVAKRIETHFTLRVDDLEATVESGAGAGVRPTYPQEVVHTAHESVHVRDRYLAVDARGPLALERDYVAWSLDDATGEIAGPDGVGPALVGRTVRFARDESGAWRRQLVPLPPPDGTGEEEDATAAPSDALVDVEKLAPAIDFVALLPPGDVAEGASWEVPLAALEPLATPALDLRRVLDPERAGAAAESASLLVTLLGEPADGAPPPRARCTLRAVERRDGRTLAIVDVELRYEATLEPGPAARDALASGIAGGATLTLERLVHEIALAARGELVWDVGAGRFHALELTATLDVTRVWSARLDHPERTAPLSARQHFHVELTTAAAVE